MWPCNRLIHFSELRSIGLLGLAEKAVQSTLQRMTQLGAIRRLTQQAFLIAVGEVAHFDQQGRHIRRFQHGETGEAVRAAQQLDVALELLDHCLGDARGQVHGLALGPGQ